MPFHREVESPRQRLALYEVVKELLALLLKRKLSSHHRAKDKILPEVLDQSVVSTSSLTIQLGFHEPDKSIDL